MPTLTNTFATVNPYISDLFFNTQHKDVTDVVQLDAEAKQFTDLLTGLGVDEILGIEIPSPVALVQDFQARL